MKSLKPAVKPIRTGDSGGRITAFVFAAILIMGLVAYRLFNLTFVQHSFYVESAQTQYNNPSALLSGRGNIYFSDNSTGARKIAATNKSSFYLFINKSIDSPQEVALKIAPLLNKKADSLESELSQKDKTYYVIARGLAKEQADQITKLKITGLNVASEVNRIYPLGLMAASVLGFVGFDSDQRVGQYGVESYYDDVLSGETRTQSFIGTKTYSDILKFLKFWEKDSTKETTTERETGNDIVLTVDPNIQSLVEIKLNALLKKWSAPSGSVIVQDPATGEILAMAASPSFDPNNYSDYELKNFLNPNVQEIFEPGSSFKSVTMAAAVDSGAVTPETTYYDTGEVKVGGFSIKNFNEKANGTQTMRQVLQHSLNTGAIFAESKMGDDTFLNHVVGFGFGQKTGADLSGEVAGNISNLYSGRKINFMTASYGQGIAVTPLQLINAYSAVANGGKLMLPHLVKEIVYPNGTKTEIKPKIIGSPITEDTANKLKSMLVDVVEKGFDKAKIAGYDVAGKTGTAQIPDGQGGYLANDQFIHNFVGFAPAYSPKFTILIKMDKPRGIKFAADSLSPVFGDIARFLIRYFNIPPTRS
jgi:cell division protein FtsI (penicillin-binding protein 3)/stage V sporulation protein D (sporulation-specific penicillin-binding protein)